ncbi:MAG: sel1 repeat family protein, partial [Clostridia bacterium]|nr:sel1 repeat family protein [Clostridia bacterium]
MKKYRRYNGDKAYIFASFSEKDEERAEAVLDKLISDGYRIRAEERGASSTSEDISGALTLLLILTDDYLNDPHYRKLLQKAEAEHKPLVLYVQEETPTVKGEVMRLIHDSEHTLIFRPGEEITDSKTASMLLEPALGLTQELANKLFEQAKEIYEQNESGEAMDYIKLAAGENCAKAMLWLGKSALESARAGVGSYKDAVGYLFNAAKCGDTEAIYTLGKMLIDGEAFDKSPRLAYTYVLKAAQHGHPKAQLELAEMYERGIGTEMNKSLATKWYLASAEKGVEGAYLPLGIRYLEGTELEQSNSLSIRYLTESATAGFTEADIILAHLYGSDDSGIVEPNPERSTKHFRSAAEAGICEGQYFLSLALRKGIGCRKDLKRAFYWMERAAADRIDGAEGSADAIYQLGVYYHKGIGCKKDHKRAFTCYYRAAGLGHPLALRAVSECYRRGLGIPANRKAHKLFKA